MFVGADGARENPETDASAVVGGAARVVELHTVRAAQTADATIVVRTKPMRNPLLVGVQVTVAAVAAGLRAPRPAATATSGLLPGYFTVVGMFAIFPLMICCSIFLTFASMPFGAFGENLPRPTPFCSSPYTASWPPLK